MQKCKKYIKGYLKSLDLLFVSHGRYFQLFLKRGRTATKLLKIIKELPQKYKGNIAIFVFCFFLLILLLATDFKACCSISLIKTILSIPILLYFMTFYAIWHMSYNIIKYHRLAFYDILWQMTYDMKCHKVCQYGYPKNRLDKTIWSTGFKIICQKHNQTKNAKKLKWQYFLCIFEAIPL